MPNLYRREFWQLSFGENALNSAGPSPIAQSLVYPLWQARDSGFRVDLGQPAAFGTRCGSAGSHYLDAQPDLIYCRKLEDDNVRGDPFAMAILVSRDADFRVVPQ